MNTNLWTKLKSRLTDLHKAIVSNSATLWKKQFTLPKRRKSRQTMLEEYKLYALLADKKLKEAEIISILHLTEAPERYFNRFLQPFQALKTQLDASAFRQLVIESYTYKQKRNKLVIETSAYPLFLFLGVVVTAWGFERFILPQLSQSMMLWDKTDSSILVFQLGLRGFLLTVVALFLFACVFLLRMRSFRFVYRYYLLLYQYNPVNLFSRIASLDFARYYAVLLVQGCSTQQILTALQVQTASAITGKWAQELRTSLQNGTALQQAIKQLPLEERLSVLFQVGIRTGELQRLLIEYQEIASVLLIRRMKQVLRLLQYGIYAVASLLIAVLYSLLMTPISVITEL